MIHHHGFGLFYDIYNIVTEHIRRQAYYVSSIFLSQFHIYKDIIEKLCFMINHYFYAITFSMN